MGSPALALVRALAVETAESRVLERGAGSVLPVLVADAPLVGAILLFTLAGAFLPRGGAWRAWAAASLRAAALVLFLLQAVDVALVTSLAMRLQLSDVVHFWREGRAGLTLAAGFQRTFGLALPPTLLALLVGAVLLSWATAALTLPLASPAPGRLRAGLAALLVASIATAALPPDRTRFHGWAYPNVLVTNLPRSTAVPYSRANLDGAVRARPAPAVRPGRGLRANVVVYVVESLSADQSRAFGGLRDDTPELDRLASRGVAATQFVANAFTTETGLVALLTGRVPIPSVGNGYRDGFAEFRDGPSLPKALAAAGYFTEFLTTYDLAFTGEGEWLKTIGFESVRGSRDPAFDGWPRFAFDAAPDEALVTAATAREQELRKAGGRPFLLVVESATSHMPFVHPNGRDHGEDVVFRYVDAQVGRLAALLARSGFLEEGILVVTSDHRKMAPLDPGEADRFGLSAFFRVPFVAIGAGLPTRRLDAPFQQVDLAGSLRCLLTDACETEPFRGTLFGEGVRPPACVLSPMANDRALVFARCGAQEAMIRLDGDATRVVEGRLAPEVAAEAFREIARVRTENAPRP